MSDIDHNVNHEAEGPFECVYVKIWTNLCVFHVGLSVFALSAKSNFIVSRSISEWNTIIYRADID